MLVTRPLQSISLSHDKSSRGCEKAFISEGFFYPTPPAPSWFENKALQSSPMPLGPFSVNWFFLFFYSFYQSDRDKEQEEGVEVKGRMGEGWRDEKDG